MCTHKWNNTLQQQVQIKCKIRGSPPSICCLIFPLKVVIKCFYCCGVEVNKVGNADEKRGSGSPGNLEYGSILTVLMFACWYKMPKHSIKVCGYCKITAHLRVTPPSNQQLEYDIFSSVSISKHEFIPNPQKRLMKQQPVCFTAICCSFFSHEAWNHKCVFAMKLKHAQLKIAIHF